MTDSDSTGPIRRILIVGGGTAGWFSAAFLSSLLSRSEGQACEIALIEASDIPTVGVGEATIPPIAQFFSRLGMPELRFMQACQATFKLGIRYAGWTEAGPDSYFYHPFFIGGTSRLLDFSNLWLSDKLSGVTVAPYAEACHVATRFAEQYRAPKLPQSGDYQGALTYAYHLDAGRLADYLKYCFRDKITHVVDKVTDVVRREDGSISHLVTATQGPLHADLFIDCSGFGSLLLDKALHEPFVGYEDCLLNDRALAAQVPYLEQGRRAPFTTARAMRSGWSWDIPLFHRRGVGYVYSSSFVSDDEAEREFRNRLGACANGVEMRKIKMRVGRHRRLWVGNCVAIGLAGGFIEPLESTGLDLIQKGLTTLLHCFPDRSFNASLAALYNETMTDYYDQIRDFIALHFCVTSRTDTPYWRACGNDLKLSDALQHILDVWRHASGKVYLTRAGALGEYFGPLSYYCILIGMGYLPDSGAPLYRIADSRGLERDWRAENAKAQQLLSILPEHDAWLSAVHG
ncbi:MAG: tryptophan 7-halogenase [Gammaproteobacteria bacterium]|jgi:tryptophan halogenase